MIDEIYDGVLINLLHKGPTAGTLVGIAEQLKGNKSVSARYKDGLAEFSTGERREEDRFFHWHYRPRVYQVLGFFDLAVLQLCDGVEIISELSAQPNVSATQNIFGLRTRTRAGDGGRLHGTLELCSPLLPYLFICNVKVHPFVQMLLGKDLHALLNLHLSRYLDEVEVFQRAAGSPREELLTIAVIDTFGWNELTFLIHGAAFDRMSEFVLNRIRALRLGDLPTPAGFEEVLAGRIRTLQASLQPTGLCSEIQEQALRNLPLFSHTESVPCIDYAVSGLLGSKTRESLLAAIGKRLRSRIDPNSDERGRYLGRAAPADIRPVVTRILEDMSADRAGCLSGFSIHPGRDPEFHHRFSGLLAAGSRPEVVLGQYDAFFRQFHEEGSQEGLLDRMQRLAKMRSRVDGGEGPPVFDDLVASSKTAICSPVVLQEVAFSADPFKELRVRLPRILTRAKPGWGQMPKPLQISLEHTLEPFYSFLQNPTLFSQYIDLYIPLLLITRETERAAAGKWDDHRPIAEHVSRELRQFNHAFQARFQASHLNSESTESTLEFKAHTVTPLDTIQGIIDCFTQVFVGFDKIAGFPVISVSNRPAVQISRVFSVELNSIHLLYPESLPALFHELGHLYLRYRGLPRSGRASADRESSCLHRMLQIEDRQTMRRWRAFTALISDQEPGQSVYYADVAYQVEDILSDLFLLTTVCRNDWQLFLWYVLVQIESMPEYFPEEAGPDDREQVAFYREVLTRLFLVHGFWDLGASGGPEPWVAEIRLDRFRSFADSLRGQSRKIRDFCAKGDAEQLDLAAWTLTQSLVQPERSLIRSSRGRLPFQENGDFWRDDSGAVFSHPDLPAMLMSLIHENYRWMLEDITASWILSSDESDLRKVTEAVEIDLERLREGESSLAELSLLFAQLVSRDEVDPVAYLEELRAAPSSTWGWPAGLSDEEAWPFAHWRMTKALYALVKFFQQENTDGPEDFRYLYRNPKTGEPERFKSGKSDVKASPVNSAERPPLPIVIDRQGVFFCRSTSARRRAFQYRNAVIRELADLHSKLRPRKMAELMRITRAYSTELGAGLKTAAAPDPRG